MDAAAERPLAMAIAPGSPTRRSPGAARARSRPRRDVRDCWTFTNLVLTRARAAPAPARRGAVHQLRAGAYTSGRAARRRAVRDRRRHDRGRRRRFDEQVVHRLHVPDRLRAGRLARRPRLRTRTRLTEELHEAAVQAQEAHEAEIARAAADERRRIAREMHDVVAHSVSVMVVQAGGARRILERDPRARRRGRRAHRGRRARGADRDAAAARRAAPRRRGGGPRAAADAARARRAGRAHARRRPAGDAGVEGDAAAAARRAWTSPPTAWCRRR